MSKQRAMRTAENHVSIGRQIAVRRKGQGEARMRASVDPAAHLIAHAHNEPMKKGIAFAKPKSLCARV
jgi:hypothetical protein